MGSLNYGGPAMLASVDAHYILLSGPARSSIRDNRCGDSRKWEVLTAGSMAVADEAAFIVRHSIWERLGQESKDGLGRRANQNINQHNSSQVFLWCIRIMPE